MSSEIQMKENKMCHTPIPKLLFTMAIPAIFSMLVQALYNVIDSLYVSTGVLHLCGKKIWLYLGINFFDSFLFINFIFEFAYFLIKLFR